VRLYYSAELGCVKGVKARHGWSNPPSLVTIGSDAFPEVGALSLGAGEAITSVSWASKGGCMSYLSLATNKGRDVSAGVAPAEGVATYAAKEGEYLAAFKGATGLDNANCSPLAALSFRWGFDDCAAPAAVEAPAAAVEAPAAAVAEEEAKPACAKTLMCFGANGGSAKCAGLACDVKTGAVVCRSKLCALNPLVGRPCEDQGAASCPAGAGDNLIGAYVAQAQAKKAAAKSALAMAKDGLVPTVGLKLVPVDVPVPSMPSLVGGVGVATADLTFPTFTIAKKAGTGAPAATLSDGLGLGHKKLGKLVAKAAALAGAVPTVTVEQGPAKTVKVPVVTMPTLQAGGLRSKTLQVPVVSVAFPNKMRAAAAAEGDAAAASAAATGVPAVPLAAAPGAVQDKVMNKLADVLEAAGPKLATTLSAKVNAAEPLINKIFGEPPATAPVNIITNTGAPGGLATLEAQYDLLARAQAEPRLFGTILRGLPQALSTAFTGAAATTRAAASSGRRLMGVSHLASKAAAVGPAVQAAAGAAQQLAALEGGYLAGLKAQSAPTFKIDDGFFAKTGKLPVAVRLVDVVDLADLAACKWAVCGALVTEAPFVPVEGVVVEAEAMPEVAFDHMREKKSLLGSLRQKMAGAPKAMQLAGQLMATDLQAAAPVVAAPAMAAAAAPMA